MKRIALLAGLAALLAAPTTSIAQENPFSSVTVFGDSLSDNGNTRYLSLPLQGPARFTTNPGLTTVEYIAFGYGYELKASLLGGGNYAYGGAGILNNAPGTSLSVPIITNQVLNYLATHPQVDQNALFIIRGAGNDNFYHLNRVGGALETNAQAIAALGVAGQQTAVLVQALQAAGADTVIVFDSGNTGASPFAASVNATAPGAAQLMTDMALSYNAGLNTALAGNNHVVRVDAFRLFQEIAADPASYGFLNMTATACSGSSITCLPANLANPQAAQTYYFADSTHPTTGANVLFAQYVLAELAAPGQISLLAEVPLSTTDRERETVRDPLRRSSGTGLFGKILSANQGFDDSAFNPETDTTDVTMVLGYVKKLGENTRIALTGTLARQRVDFGGGEFSLDEALLAAHVARTIGEHGYVTASINAGRLDFGDVTRRFSLAAATRDEHGQTQGSSTGANVSAGWVLQSGRWNIEPFITYDFQRISVDGFSESGTDSSAMTFGDQSRDRGVTEVGARFNTRIDKSWGALSPYATFTYDHDDRAQAREVVASLTALNGSFALPGFTPGDKWATAEFGVSADLGERGQATVGYSRRWGSNQDDQAFGATFTGRF